MSKRNENRPGYKKTKVGWIPEDWECLTIKEVCSQPVSGFSAKGNAEAVSPNDSNIGVLRLSCIIEGYFNSYENKKVVQADIPKVKTPISKDTMLISRSNTEELVGVVCYVEKDYPNLFLSDLIWQVSAKSSEILSIRWLTNLLLTKEYRRKIAARANGTSGSMKKITKGGFLTLPIPLPPLPEQKKIAGILSVWDRAIEQVGKLIDAKLRLKKGLMQQLLTGRMRFPEFNHETHERHEKDKGELPEGWKKSKLGWIPEEWEICPVRQFGTVTTGNTPSKKEPENYGKGIPWCTAVDMEHKYIVQTEVELSEIGAQKARILPSGAVLITCIASIGKNAIAKVALATNQQINAVIVNNHNDNEFFYYAACQNEHRMLRYAGQTAVPILNKSEFENMLFIRPHLSEQRRIASVLSTCDKEIELLKKKQEKLKEQRKGLMQKLLTGEVRVKADGAVI
ncbi:MAG: hypothetical protein C4B57_05730 [Deltaproteobacteria bacterium]|nr:MAG: hypothetical protein C4B57_05730 [Deltaproteobacteria bacterium]